jgi:hypothetical protein
MLSQIDPQYFEDRLFFPAGLIRRRRLTRDSGALKRMGRLGVGPADDVRSRVRRAVGPIGKRLGCRCFAMPTMYAKQTRSLRRCRPEARGGDDCAREPARPTEVERRVQAGTSIATTTSKPSANSFPRGSMIYFMEALPKSVNADKGAESSGNAKPAERSIKRGCPSTSTRVKPAALRHGSFACKSRLPVPSGTIQTGSRAAKVWRPSPATRSLKEPNPSRWTCRAPIRLLCPAARPHHSAGRSDGQGWHPPRHQLKWSGPDPFPWRRWPGCHCGRSCVSTWSTRSWQGSAFRRTRALAAVILARP